MERIEKIRESLHVCIGRIEVLKECCDNNAKTDPYFEWDNHARNMAEIIKRLEGVDRELKDLSCVNN